MVEGAGVGLRAEFTRRFILKIREGGRFGFAFRLRVKGRGELVVDLREPDFVGGFGGFVGWVTIHDNYADYVLKEPLKLRVSSLVVKVLLLIYL